MAMSKCQNVPFRIIVYLSGTDRHALYSRQVQIVMVISQLMTCSNKLRSQLTSLKPKPMALQRACSYLTMPRVTNDELGMLFLLEKCSKNQMKVGRTIRMGQKCTTGCLGQK